MHCNVRSTWCHPHTLRALAMQRTQSTATSEGDDEEAALAVPLMRSSSGALMTPAMYEAQATQLTLYKRRMAAMEARIKDSSGSVRGWNFAPFWPQQHGSKSDL